MPEQINAQIDYDSVLAELYAKRDEIEVSINTILFLKGSGSATSPEKAGGSGMPRGARAGVIPSNAFFGMSLVDAAKKYIELSQAKRTLQQIVKGLEEGGMPPQKINTVYAALRRRESTVGDIMKVGEEWGLKDWFAGISVGEAVKVVNGKKTKKGKKKRAKKAAKSIGSESAKKTAPPIAETPESETKQTAPTEAGRKETKSAKPISMVNAVFDILTQADKPLHADVLVEKLKQDYGKTTTNVKSIAASLPQDSTKRFYNIGGNTWALEIWRGSDRVKPKAATATATA
jgi:DNA-directed RNA polymerase delta subunit